MPDKPTIRDIYEARLCPGIPTDCCDYGVISHATGKEVCRVWQEDDARLIANLLNGSREASVAELQAEVERLRAENERLFKSGEKLLELKANEAAEARFWFNKAQEWKAQKEQAE